MSECQESGVGNFEIDVTTGRIRFYAHNMKDTEVGCILCANRDTCNRDEFPKKCHVPCG